MRRPEVLLPVTFLVVFLSILLVDVFEGGSREHVLPLIFEAVSAFGTVGLSMGVTAGLTTASKILLCVVMFVGRVGSLSLFVLLVRDTSPTRVRYPEERIMVG